MSLIEFAEVVSKLSSLPGVVTVDVFVNVDSTGKLTEVSGNKVSFTIKPSVAKQ